jgi:hypothetical protein
MTQAYIYPERFAVPRAHNEPHPRAAVATAHRAMAARHHCGLWDAHA